MNGWWIVNGKAANALKRAISAFGSASLHYPASGGFCARRSLCFGRWPSLANYHFDDHELVLALLPVTTAVAAGEDAITTLVTLLLRVQSATAETKG